MSNALRDKNPDEYSQQSVYGSLKSEENLIVFEREIILYTRLSEFFRRNIFRRTYDYTRRHFA